MDPEQSTTIFRILGMRGGSPSGFSGIPLFLKTDESPKGVVSSVQQNAGSCKENAPAAPSIILPSSKSPAL
jgi:hypothetical protein